MAHRSVIPLRVGVLPNQDEAIYNELEGRERKISVIPYPMRARGPLKERDPREGP